MSNSYQVGNSNNAISLAVKCGTGATCHSTTFLKDAAGVKTKVANSTDTTNGAIANTKIGPAGTLSGKELVIQSLADFSALPDNVAASIAANHSDIFQYLVLEYDLSGGTGGNAPYPYTIQDVVVSTSGKMASIVVHILLVS